MMRVPPNLSKAPLASKPGTPKMYEKQNAPRQPTLAALTKSSKSSNRKPLTPKVAGSAQSATSTTPAAPRTLCPETKPGAARDENISTPVSSVMGSNITPRSAARRSRIDSPAANTPGGSPIDSTSPNEPRLSQNGSVYNGGLGIYPGSNKDLSKRATVSFSPGVSDIGISRPQSQITPSESKFFHASDAKPNLQPTRPTLPSKNSSSTFLYANGQSIPSPPSSYSQSGSIVGEERAQPKFFHANGTELPPPMTQFPPKPSSVLSSNSRASPRIGIGSPAGTLSPPQKQASSSNLNVYASISSLRPTPNLPSPFTPRTQPNGRGQSASSVTSNRRTSLEAQKTHSRTSSIDSPETKVAQPRRVSGASYVEPTLGSPLGLTINTIPVATLEEKTQDEATVGLRSPIKAGKTMDELNELAANARRERKVLDLEITNSSLEAINRTLEREMRKQTAELRRYRRLSRSGRLSINTTGSMRSTSSNRSVVDEAGNVLSDMSEEEDEEDEEEYLEDEYSDDASLSPSAMAESDARHRQRDEKRLQLDLSKHQQLLIDSQKMNQSLKRCIGWTEVLINEAKKALEYNVKISDVELGGRVLAPDEVEERRREDENEGMSDLGAQMLREARERQAAVAKQINDELDHSAAWGGDGRDDRDSGIELDSAQREQYAGLQ